ncbi:SHOCT domain-containing protein [Halostella pelagica]|uniref:SHOCT domain-containing protein n=1 Tax=Halostella pelagica TaxID=2583824 RepID=UPI001081D220|nr:SHOCT domain-containing protein [Halostella pelagica]
MNARNAIDLVLDPDIIVFLVLGVGITAAFFDLWFAGLVFALGFGVLLPLSDVLSKKLGTDEESDTHDKRWDQHDIGEESDEVDESAALETLRERYAHGEIDEIEYERRLEDLLATESVDDAREYVAERRSGGERDRTVDRDRSPERERR